MRRWQYQRATQTGAIVIFSIIAIGAATGCTPELEQLLGETFGGVASSGLQQLATFGADLLRSLFAAFVL